MELGINLLIAEHGGQAGSNIGTSYVFPSMDQIDYYAAKGFTQIRLPMPWERLQDNLYSQLDATYIAKVGQLVDYAKQLGMDVVLDVHNYGAYEGNLIGSSEVPVGAFTDLWSKLGAQFAGQDNVKFGLMNETQVESAQAWLDVNNAAIAAIRDAGATQQIMVSGVDWQAANRWTINDNSKVYGQPNAVIDPANNFVIELHQYLDDTSGQNAWVVSETIGVERLTAVTEWAREHGYQLYLGEFAVADNAKALSALNNMMSYMQSNGDVWQGAAYWGGGEGWTDYMFSPNPDLGILDVAQMKVLDDYTGATYARNVQQDGSVRVETHLPGRDAPSIVDVMTNKGELISRTLFGTDGEATRSVTHTADGNFVVHSYANLADGVVETSVTYNANQERISERVVADDHSAVVTQFAPGAHDGYLKSFYAADGALAQQQAFDGNGVGISIYENGHLAQIDQYNTSWQLVSKSSFDADGTLVSYHHENGDGTRSVEQYDAVTGVITGRTEYSANWQTTAFSGFDGKGNLSYTSYDGENGAHTIERFDVGQASFSTQEVYDSNWKLVSKMSNEGSDGFVNVVYANAGQSLIATKEVYDAQWSLQSRTSYDGTGKLANVYEVAHDGSNIIKTFTASNQGTPATVDTYTAEWQMVKRVHLASDGDINSIDWMQADGSHVVQTFGGDGKLASADLFGSNWSLLSRIEYDGMGNVASVRYDTGVGHRVEYFVADNQDSPAYVDLFNTSWSITSRTHYDQLGNIAFVDNVNADGTHRVEQFSPGVQVASSESIYSSDWNLMSATTLSSVNAGLTHDDGAINLASLGASALVPDAGAATVVAEIDLWSADDVGVVTTAHTLAVDDVFDALHLNLSGHDLMA